MIEVGDPLQVPCNLCSGAYRLLNMGPEPVRGIVFPEWTVRSAFDSGAFGKPESDKCVCVLDPMSRVHLELQDFFHRVGGGAFSDTELSSQDCRVSPGMDLLL